VRNIVAPEDVDGGENACCNSQKSTIWLCMHEHQCNYTGCNSQMSLKALEVYV
jgi:hypothetical protein